MVRDPALGFAEIAWRWSFGLTGGVLVSFALMQYLDSLPVTDRDLFFLRTGQRALVLQALARIFQGSAGRLALAAAVLLPALALAWILAGSLGRAATLRALVDYFRPDREESSSRLVFPISSLLGLNLLRVGVTLAAGLGCLGAALLANLASPRAHPSPGSAFLIFVTIVLSVWLAWVVVNWFLSLASVFVVDGGEDTFGAIAAAVALCRTRTASVLAPGIWFGLAHLTAFLVATSVVAFPLAFLGVLPAGFVLGGVLVVTLLYLAIADFLYIGRLAAYVAILELPPPAAPPIEPPALPLATAIDKDELILSDTASAQQSGLSVQPAASVDKDEPILGDIRSAESLAKLPDNTNG